MASPLRFRNIGTSPEDPIESWPFEGVLAALEWSTLPDWSRLIGAIDEEPWGTVARIVGQAFRVEFPYGVGPLFETA